MNFFLQNPAWLALLALAGVPLLVHLVSRAKPPVHLFSNIEFLRKAIVHRVRFRKPKDWLMLLLRTLAVLAIAGAFLQPILQSHNAPLPGEKRTIVLLIDRSASMAAKEGASTRFDTATSTATSVLTDFDPDLANIVWIDQTPGSAFPEPAPNLNYLKDELARSAPHPEPGSIDRALELALQQLQQAPGRRELHILSDFQESTWKQATLDLPDTIHVIFHPCAKTTPANVAIQSLVSLPASPVAGQRLTTQCRVVNYSDEARRVDLTLDAGGSRQSQSLSIPANSEAEAAFQIHLTNPGLLPITAEINTDTFPMDNQRHAVIRVRESLRLAVAATDDHPACDTLNRVASAIPWLEVTTDAKTDKPTNTDILFIPNWDGSNAQSLHENTSSTSLLIQPAPNCPPAALHRLLEIISDNPNPIIRQELTPGWTVNPNSEHPAFRLFAGGQFGNPLEGRFRERILLPELPNTTTLALFSDQKPALIQAKSRPILISALSLDPAKSSWPGEGSFIPAIGELLLHLSPQGTWETHSANPGDLLSWTNPDTTTSIDPTLQAPDQSTLPLEAHKPTWQCPTPATPGIYRWLVSEQPVQLTAVNFPESESNLKPLQDTPSTTGFTNSSNSKSKAALDEGIPLWPYLVAAALLLLVIEALAERLLFPKSAQPEPS